MTAALAKNEPDRKRRRILFLTGTRADFGKLKPLMLNVENSEEFECHIFATGMHPLAKYGSTYDEIRKCGFKNVFVFINQLATQSAAMDLILANTIQGLGHYVREFSPDLLIVHGDRVEALAGAIVGALNNILVAHIEGGELSGTVDELIRHSVSKLAHIHFVANEEAHRRLLQMGEKNERIFVVGSPDVDVMLSDRLPDIATVKEWYGIDFEEYGIFSYHPVTTELPRLRRHMEEIAGALVASGLKFVVIHPNNDSGSEIIMEGLEPLRARPEFRLFPSLRFEYFLTLLRHAKAIVGNSSAGIRESVIYGVPSVNIGSRQLNRYHGSLIVNVSEERGAILQALANLPARGKPSYYFGDGKSGDNFMRCLRAEKFWQVSCQKQFNDMYAAPVDPFSSFLSKGG